MVEWGSVPVVEWGSMVVECSGEVGEWSGGGDVAYREKENGPDLMVVPMLCLYRLTSGLWYKDAY